MLGYGFLMFFDFCRISTMEANLENVSKHQDASCFFYFSHKKCIVLIIAFLFHDFCRSIIL